MILWKSIALFSFANSNKHLAVSHTGLLIILMLLATSSCIYIPTPEFGHMSGRAMITESDIELLKSGKGEITRENVLLQYGDPNKRINFDEYFCYGWERIQGVWFTGDPSGYGGGSAGAVGKAHWLCIQFDQDGMLIRAEHIKPILFGNATNKRDSILQEWNKTGSSEELIFTGDHYELNRIKLDIIYSMAQQGFPESQYRLYDEFGRKPQDITWLCRSADNGYAKAQLEVGNLYKSASDIKQNMSKSYVWYKLAATGDNLQGLIVDDRAQANAATAMQDVKSTLTPSQIIDAENYYSAWNKGQCELELMRHTKISDED